MSYLKENVAKVNEEFAEKRKKALAEQEKALALAYEKIPELQLIDIELSQASAKIFKATSLGKEGLAERVSEIKNENLALQKKRAELLVKHGLSPDYTSLKCECKKCSDYGFVNGKMCSCYKASLINKQYESSGIGNLLKSQSFETFSLDYYEDKEKARIILDLIKEYAECFGKEYENILLMGGTGLGKTHLSTSVARVLIENGYNVVYETAQNIFADFEADRFRDKFSDSEIRSQRYLDCDLLIIDDLGAEAINQYSVACLYNILNTRLNKRLPIMASTNLNSIEIKRQYSDRITSRLFGEFSIYLLKGTDIRQKKN